MRKGVTDEQILATALKLRRNLVAVTNIAKQMRVDRHRVVMALMDHDPAIDVVERHALEGKSLHDIAAIYGVKREAVVPVAKVCSEEAQMALESHYATNNRNTNDPPGYRWGTNWSAFFSNPANRKRNAKSIAAELEVTTVAVLRAAQRRNIRLPSSRPPADPDRRKHAYAAKRFEEDFEEAERLARQRERIARWNAQAAAMGYSVEAGR